MNNYNKNNCDIVPIHSHIFSYLYQKDALQFSLTCKQNHHIFQHLLLNKEIPNNIIRNKIFQHRSKKEHFCKIIDFSTSSNYVLIKFLPISHIYSQPFPIVSWFDFFFSLPIYYPLFYHPIKYSLNSFNHNWSPYYYHKNHISHLSFFFFYFSSFIVLHIIRFFFFFCISFIVYVILFIIFTPSNQYPDYLYMHNYHFDHQRHYQLSLKNNYFFNDNNYYDNFDYNYFDNDTCPIYQPF